MSWDLKWLAQNFDTHYNYYVNKLTAFCKKKKNPKMILDIPVAQSNEQLRFYGLLLNETACYKS
jgi:hypothetical protein